jgi:hypothetical protein
MDQFSVFGKLSPEFLTAVTPISRLVPLGQSPLQTCNQIHVLMKHRKNHCGLNFSGQTENEVVACQLHTHARVKVISLTENALSQGKISRDFLKLRNIGMALLFSPLLIGVACNLSNIGSRTSRKNVGP